MPQNKTELCNTMPNPLLSVNISLTNRCNYHCQFCFSRFSPHFQALPISTARNLLQDLANAGTEKITFVGGEPLVYPKLGQLLEYSKEVGLTSSIVTNGSLLTTSFIQRYCSSIDWVGLSLDSCYEDIEALIGRQRHSYRIGQPGHVSRVRYLVPVLKKWGVRVKVNTVVTKLNFIEDMSNLIGELEPERWKVFQVMRVVGENDGLADPLMVNEEEFRQFVVRHEPLKPVSESGEMMRGSYVMVDPLGRFFCNDNGYHLFSRPIQEVGVHQAFSEVIFSANKFIDRQGLYNWSVKPEV